MVLLTVVVLVLTLLASELGFRAGRHMLPELDEQARSQQQAMQAALLGLLALFLGFSFAMAQSRFDARKMIVIEEANAIGTAGLRTRVLPEPQATDVRDALRRYVDGRLALYRRGNASVAEESRASEILEQAAWPKTVEVSRQDPRSVSAGLMLQALNEVIDLNAKRIAVTNNHVPLVVLVVLLFVAMVALFWVGMATSFTGRRSWLTMVTLSLLVSLVAAVIVDLDQPRRGLIRVSQDALVEVRRGLQRG